MARGKARDKVVLTVATVAFSLVAYNAFAIGDHYGKDHLTLTIEKIKPLKDGKIEIHYRTLAETVWWCPGANGKNVDAGTELTFVRAFHKHKPKVTYPRKPGEKGAAIIVVANDGKPVFRVAGEKRIKVYPVDDVGQSDYAEQLESSAWWLNRAVDYAKQIEDAEARSEANNKLVYALTQDGDFARALQSACEVTKPQIRVYALSRIAKLAHEKGDTATCDEALRIARAIAIPAQFVSLGMIRLYFELDRSDEAVTFAAAVPDRYQKRYAYQTVADEMAKQGRIDEALAIISRHKPATSQDSGRASIAIACARTSRFDRAIELAEKVEKVTSRDAAYDHIAEELINAGRLDEGKAIALRIQDDRKRSDRLADHLSTSVKSKDGAKSIDAAMAEAATREEKVSIGMLKFAELIKQREIEKAEALIVSLVKIIEDAPREPQVTKFGTFDDSLQIATIKAGYMETAKMLKEAGDEAGAKDRVAKALAAVKAIKSPSIGKSLLAAKIVRSQAELGDTEGAQASSSLFDTDFMLSNSKGDLAASLILSGKVDEGLELAHEIDPQHYAYGTRRVATALISVKRFDKLAGYLPLIPDTGNDIRAFRGIAQELVKSGNVKRLDLLLDSLPSDAARTQACLGAYDQLRVE